MATALRDPSGALGFIHELTPEAIPASAKHAALRSLLDLAGIAAGAATLPLSRIICNHAVRQFGAGEGQRPARLIIDGRRASPAGAALAGGMLIDALDGHDGHKLTKGHAGCGALPALAALWEAEPRDGQETGADFLAAFVLAYEIGVRAGIGLHRTAADYHTSGAWIALAAAALGARRMGLGPAATREALGIAEYHGPRSQMMRCIDWPTMLKDGSGWGAMAGVSAAYLAADGFTGAPALTVEGADVADLWADLGQRWRMEEQYLKPYPVCRWAQPPAEAAVALQKAHDVPAGAIAAIEVETFAEAVRLATAAPASTEEAQYSLPFTVAALLVRGRIGAEEVGPNGLSDPEILRLARATSLTEDRAFCAAFPNQRIARTILVLRDGTRLVSEPTEARGDPETALTDAEVAAKYEDLAAPALGAARAGALKNAVMEIDSADHADPLLDLLTAPPRGIAADSGAVIGA